MQVFKCPIFNNGTNIINIHMRGTAIVIGATGLIGSLLVQDLLKNSQFTKVKALLRKPLPLRDGRLEQVVVDFTDDMALESVLHGDVLFCCIGTTIKKAGSQEAFNAVDYAIPVRCGTIARKNGITQFHLVSSIGAQASSKNFYLRTKGRTEAALRALQFPSLFIYQPSFLTGNRKEVRFGEQIAIMLMPVFSFLMRGRWRKYRPVKAENVAIKMRELSESGKTGVHYILFHQS